MVASRGSTQGKLGARGDKTLRVIIFDGSETGLVTGPAFKAGGSSPWRGTMGSIPIRFRQSAVVSDELSAARDWSCAAANS